MVSFNYEVSNTVEALKKADAQGLANIEQFEKKLSESEAYQMALKVGDKVPDFSLPDTDGKLVDVRNMYKEKFLVLVFYRGQWCPFCNIQLRDLQKSLSGIEGAPARLLAVSPQKPDMSAETRKKLSLNFAVLSDQGNKVARKFNLVYVLPNYLIETYKGFGVDIQHHNGEEVIELPFPAIYVINKQGVIIQAYVGSKLSERVEGQEIVRFLKTQL